MNAFVVRSQVPCAMRVLTVASAIILEGCSGTTTIRVPAKELPWLSTNDNENATAWSDVHTIDDKPWRIKGTITDIRIRLDDEIAYITPPFTAKIEDETLDVFYRNRRWSFAMSRIQHVSIDYQDAKLARKRAGTVMVSIGGSCLLWTPLMLWLFQPRPGQSWTWDNFGVQFATALAVTHFTLTIPGIYVLSTDPPPPGRSRATFRPMVHIQPNGVAISGAF